MERRKPLERRTALGPGKRALERGSTFASRGQGLERRTELARVSRRKVEEGRAPGRPRARAISEASPAQREKARDGACVVCRRPGPNDPAHLISRAALSAGQDDPLAIVPLCRPHHDDYDQGRLDLLPYLEPHWRDEIAFAVQRYGLVATLRRITNDRHE